jgi:SulP family sulfate permease
MQGATRGAHFVTVAGLFPGVPVFPSSSTIPPGAPAPANAPGWRRNLTGALDGAAFIIPLSLGSASLVYGRIAPELLAAGVFAVVLGLVVLHLASAHGNRPLCWSARFFEAAALATMLEQAFGRLPGWNVPDTLGVRIALLCLIGTAAGVWVGVLYLMRADRFTRYIPAPVFAGFANSIAVALLISQSGALWTMSAQPGAAPAVLSVAAAALVTAVAIRRQRPGWPATAIGLAAGLALGLAWLAAGRSVPLVGNLSLTLPVALADFQTLRSAAGAHADILALVVTNAAILGTMMFINTSMAAQNLTQHDGRRASRAGSALPVAALVLGGAIGAAPMSGTPQASLAAARNVPLSGRLLVCCALVLATCYFSSLLAWIPLAAICGGLLAEAWFMTDRRSLQLLGAWARRRPMTANAREDLALIVTVTATAVLINMVAAVFVGLLLGLVLYAARNASKPVRNTWTGLQVRSNCARSRGELQVLEQQGGSIRVFELEGDLFFGTADALEQEVRAGMAGAACVLLDWSRSRHIDSSVIQAVAQIDRVAAAKRVLLLHAGCSLNGGVVAQALRESLPHAELAPDLDRALELAENRLIQVHRDLDASAQATTLLESAALYRGLDEAARNRLEQAMEHKLYGAGDHIVRAGDAADALMLVLFGSASIVVDHPDLGQVRLAGVRRGATIGEIGFLDRAPRSASVIAQEDTCVAVLSRQRYESLCTSDPQLVRQLLENIALDVAARLRQTNQLALARQRQQQG